MPRLILAALFALFSSGLCRAEDDAGKKSAPFPRDGSYDFLKSYTQAVRHDDDAAPEGKRVLGKFSLLLEKVSSDARDADPKDRDGVIADGLSDINAAALAIDEKSADRKTLKKVYNGAAYLNNRAGRYEDSRALTDKVLAQDPDDRDALINRSAANAGLGNFPKSYADAQRAAKLDPKSPDAYTARAAAAYGMNNYLQALEDARRALALNPDDKTAFSLLKLAEGRARPAAEVPAVKSEQAAAVEREYHGMVSQINQVDEKRRLPLPEATPKGVEAILHNAGAKIAVKDYWGGLAETERALKVDPGNEQAYYYRAAAHNLLGDYESSLKDATQALSLDPTDVAVRDARAWAFYRLGRYQEAVADANYSLELNPKNAYAYANRGYAHERLGDLGSMLTDLKTAATLNAQFEPTYRDAAIANHVEPEPIAGRAFAPPPEDRPRAAARLHHNSFLTVLASSAIGGILIALGILHVFSGKKTGSTLRQGQRITFAGPKMGRPAAIDATYEIGATLGQGGMGVVYRAFDRALKRDVAIKMLRPELQKDAGERERFLQEARTVAALHHPAIVEIYSIVEDPAGLYLVFEYLEGHTVETHLAQRKRFTLAQAQAVLQPVCQALEYAHGRGVVHRDLKPSNIMITRDKLVKVMDFGIARSAKECLCRINNVTMSGTPHYMAPEQEQGSVCRQSDIFSLGVCLYEMVTGERPFPSAGLAQKLARRYAKASLLAAGLPSEIDAVIDGALHPESDKRIHSAKAFWDLLSRVGHA